MARVAGVRTLPVAIHYAFANVEAPEIRIAFGAPLALERDVARARTAQEAAVTALLATIDEERARESDEGLTNPAFEVHWQAKSPSDFASWTLARMFPLVDGARK